MVQSMQLRSIFAHFKAPLMYRISLALVVLVLEIWTVSAAEKDTPAAAKTRKKLLTKVTVDFKGAVTAN